jgi:urease accessory protein
MRRAEQRLTGGDAAALRGVDLPTVALPYLDRSKSRFKAKLGTADDIGVFLPRGTILRGGDVLVCDDAQLVRVVAADEDVMVVRSASLQSLTRAAYHLGNRHVQMEIGVDYLKLDYDGVLADMLKGLDVRVERLQASFEPEAGAYGGHGHGHGERSG